MDKLEFYRDESGVPSARGVDQRLATWLQTDIQGSPEIAEQLARVLNDSSYRGEITGNAHTVTVTGKLATIESLFDDDMPARRLSREQLLLLVNRWLTFIRMT